MLGDPQLNQRHRTDRHGQGRKQPKYVRGPDIYPAAEHAGASEHIVHFGTPRASID
jgi:hypothetical protein